MTQRDFAVSGSFTTIRYSVGQPMGSKASFAIASLTHHAFIHYCFHLLPKEVKASADLSEIYAIVGDDLVIAHEALANKVKEQYNILDVKIQDAKSKIPVGNEL